MLHICQDCTCGFSVGAPRCPHCTGIRYKPQGEDDGPVYSTETGEPIADLVGEEGPGLAEAPKTRRKPDTTS